MTKRRGEIQRRSRGRRSGDLLKSEVPLYAAYLILLIRLVALLTVQLHIDPAQQATLVPHAIERSAHPVVVADVAMFLGE